MTRAELSGQSSRISRADVFALSAPIHPPAGVSIGLATAHEYVLVRLTDSDGTEGWGETYLLPGVVHTVASLAHLVIGHPAGDMRDHQRRLSATRTSSYARSAIMIALDDLRARQLGVPVHRLYGGPTRSDVQVYAASQGYVEGVELEHTWAHEVETFVGLGYSALKLRTGRFPVAREAEALRAVRELVGHSVTLMVDGNGGYSMGEAVRMGRELSDLGARWFEEPLPQDGYSGYPELRAKLDLPLAGGEILENTDDALGILRAGAVDIVQPDVVICGGIGSALAVSDLANLHGVAIVPHTSGGAIGIAATLQLLAVLDEPTRSPGSEPLLLEFGQGVNPWRTDILQRPHDVRGGRLPIPEGPGLGVEVDAGQVASRAVEHLEVSQ